VAFVDLWDDVAAVKAPTLLIRGGTSGVVSDDDVEELRRRKPDAEVLTVDGAGHSIQGDRPVELARILAGFVSV
jgi:pimeloyl-ACP methyl ester carboxylesterase